MGAFKHIWTQEIKSLSTSGMCLSSYMTSSAPDIKSWQILSSVSELKYHCMIHYHEKGWMLNYLVHYTLRWKKKMKYRRGGKKIFRYKICDSWQINFSLVHASQGENSCSQTASGSWYTADPTQGLYRSGSHPPEEQGAPYCGRVSIFYGTDPGAAVPWLRKKKKAEGTLRTYFLASKLLCFA